MDFKHQLLMTVIDKGLLALVALILGGWINKRLEEFKAAQQQIANLERDKSTLQMDLEKSNRATKLDFMEKQLSSLYWPVYLRLMKDDAMWRLVPGLSSGPNLLPPELGKEIERSFLISNHSENVQIIEGNIHLLQSDTKLLDKLVAYIRHVAVYKALRDAHEYDKNPFDLGQPFPEGLVGDFKANLDELQTEYNRLLSSASVAN